MGGSEIYIALFAFYTIILIVFIYAFFFADTSGKGASGQLASDIVDSFGRVSDYVMYQRNPILIVAYLVVINGAFTGWLIYGEPQLPTKLASKIHSYGGYIGVIAAQLSFYLACTISPGVITPKNVEHFNHVPYDGLLYISDKFCTTCRIPKVARSKHCSLCGFCVPIFDHHCVWLNQCVGELNHKYFMLFLMVNSAFFIYATYVVSLVLLSEIYERDLMNAVFYNHITGEEFRADMFIVGQYVIGRHSILFAVWLIAFVMGLAVSGFLLYHLYLLWAGTTTNETFKWEFVRKVHKELTKSFTAYKVAQRYGGVPAKKQQKRRSQQKAAASATQPIPATEPLAEAPTSRSTTVEPMAANNNESCNENKSVASEPSSLQNALSKGTLDSDLVGCLPVGFSFNTPQGYQKQFIRSIMDKIDDDEDLPEYLEEDPGPLPTNLYKIGLFKTLWRVFVTKSPPLESVQSHKKSE